MKNNEPNQRERDLWESNQLLEQIFSSVEFLVAYMDSQFNYLRVNRAFAKGEVMPPESFVGKNHFDLYPNDEFKAIFKQVVEIGEAFSAESHPSVFPNHPQWGNNFWNWNLQPVKDLEGNVTRLVFSLMDVTEHKRAELQIRTLASIVESSEDAIYSYSLDGVITSWNKGAQKMYGYRAEDAIGHSISLLLPTERGNELRNILETVAQGRIIEHYETERIRKNGTPIMVSITVSPIHDEQGRVVAASTIARDVTQRRLAEDAMHESYDQLRRAEEIGKLGHWTWYIREDRVIWSDGLYRLFGLTPGEFGATYNAYIGRVHPEDVDFVQQSVGAALQQTVPFEFESRIIHKDGEIRHLFTRGEVEADADGKPLRMTGVAVDSTERAEAEKALERISDDLRRSNAELEQFAYVASHDLQEPLRMISSYLQLLSRRYQGKLDQDADEFIAFAVDGAKRLQNLINDLLAYSRVGTRGNPFSSVACESLLEEALSNLQIAIEESGAVISHDPLPVVRGDAVQLGAVFQNLLGNAIKFRGEELPRIHVGVQQQDNEWVFSICDNGIGIDPKFTERIFVIFQRLNERTAYPGTGIGLAICKRIILHHGGCIWVESEPGKGATFYFTIPKEEAS